MVDSDSVNNKQDFHDLYEATGKAIYAYIRRSIHDDSTARDLLQDVFFNFFRAFRDKPLPDIKDARPYLYRIARNNMINHWKRSDTRRIQYVPEYQETDHSMTGSGGLNPEESVLKDLEQTENQKLLEDLLGSLKENQRTALLLRYEEEMKLEEIAAIFGKSISAVSRIISRSEELLLNEAKKRGLSLSSFMSLIISVGWN